MPGVTRERNKPQEESARPEESRFDRTLRRMLNTPPQPKKSAPTKKKRKA